MKVKEWIDPKALKPILRVVNVRHPYEPSPGLIVGSDDRKPVQVEYDTDDAIVEITDGINDVLKITVDGRIVAGDGLQMDDAARALLESLNAICVTQGGFSIGMPSHR